jgi:hypothetical protein
MSVAMPAGGAGGLDGAAVTVPAGSMVQCTHQLACLSDRYALGS